MKDFTKEFKAIQKAISKCGSERATLKNELKRLTEKRLKMFADIALGLCSETEKPKINEEIKQLEEDISDLSITSEGLKIRETRLRREGLHEIEIEEE